MTDLPIRANALTNTLTIGSQVLANVPTPKIPKWVANYLLKLGGKTDHGDPYIKLVWGCKETRVWCGETRLKYPVANAVVKTGEVIDWSSGLVKPTYKRIEIGKDRWYVEEWWPPSSLGSWDVLEQGPFPSRGIWMEFMVLETDDGRYRHPDQECMEWIKEVWQKRAEARLTFDWRQGVPKEQLEKDIKEGQERLLAKQAKRQERIKERLRSSLAPHINRLRHAHPNEGQHGIYRKGNKPGVTDAKSDN